jgi:chorismate mutase
MKNFEEKIKPMREKIDILDDKILELIAQRLEVVREVGELKKEFNIPPLQPERWKEVLEKLKKKGGEKNISEELIEKIWNAIHEEALKIEE